MTIRIALGILCLLLHTGCYVSTHLEVESDQIPPSFYAPVLVVTLQESVGLHEERLIELEQDALRTLASKGIPSASLRETVDDADTESAIKLLLAKDYRAVFRIVIEFWGSKTKILQDPVPTSVDSVSDDRSSTFRPPTAHDYGETVSGPTTSYKEVAMSGSVMDLQANRLIWAGRVRASPALAGRSFFYHSFDRKLTHEELAERCFRKLAQAIARDWPAVTPSPISQSPSVQ
jgi:hypothetical protein